MTAGAEQQRPWHVDELSLAETQKLTVPAASLAGKQRLLRAAALTLAGALILALYLLWPGVTPAETPWSPEISGGTAATLTPASGERQAPIGGLPTTATSAVALSPTPVIQVYIVGAVHHPGVYALPTGSRVYRLLQVAGGPLPDANLVALNLAAVLHDGEEIYVTRVGETSPPVSTIGSGADSSGTDPATSNNSSTALVNINTASVDELRQRLHVSTTTAQNIVNYRLQHGPYTAVEQLLQVVSRSIYDRIKNFVIV
ncbi:ComEA family DNA-binding protein [Thermogemmatispora sp.]|uniref:ComEA family DNA-binding protein n=1 Tax=Thermogemmatispora sp. TaxID=1968838 RepID=UPI001D86656F|nr:ComEA family DNA-binding protein [Thermogemmatispora sp.]MBX5449964.1 helix-hairpin-helix domain-containing protein [Thermogemmatispora sp.]